MARLNNIGALCIKHPFAAIVFFGIIIRLLFYALYQQIAIYPDSEGYFALAGRLLDFNLSGYTGERIPGYPLLIALAANSAIVVVVFQTVIGFFSAWYLYKTMLLLSFSKKTALFTTVVLNSFLIVIFYETAVLTETIILFFISYIFYRLFNCFFTRPQTFLNTFWFSFILGYLVLIKPFYIFLPFLIYGLYTLKNFSFKRIINQNILLVVFPLVSFLGWSYFNKVNNGYFVSSTFFGINIAQNCVFFAEKAPADYKLISDIYVKYRPAAIARNSPDMTLWDAYEELEQKTGLGFVDLSAKLGEFGKATIAKNKEDYLRQVVLSWSYFWKTSLYLDYITFPNERNKQVFAAIWMPQRILLRGLKALFMLLVPFHLINFIRRRKVTPVFIITVIVFATSVLQALATFGTNARYSFPFEFIMVVSVMLTFKEPFAKLLNKYAPQLTTGR